jgi:nucleoside transporter
MNKTIYGQLSLMMFLEFFIWGGWFVTLGTFLGSNLMADGGQIAMAFSTQSWGAIIAPFIIGMIADRYFNAERILGAIHIVGAVLMYLMANATDFSAFYPLVLGYMVLYMPTLALVNSVSFRQLDNPAKQFGQIRVWGTIGWIVAGLVISFAFSWDSAVSIEQGLLRNTFLMTAAASLVLGIFSFTLPKTPPVRSPGEDVSVKTLLGFDALSILKDRNYLIFFVASVLICIPLAFYYQLANPFLIEVGVENATGIMTLGQMSEILFMLLLPVFILRFGLKTTLIVGMGAWFLRYVAFAAGDDGSMVLLVTGIVLHGVCYDFFFVSGQIYTDNKAGEQYKSSAQGLITLATYGAGMLIGFWAAGKLYDANTLDVGHNWMAIWGFPAIFALAVMILFAIVFSDKSADKAAAAKEAEEAVVAPSSELP